MRMEVQVYDDMRVHVGCTGSLSIVLTARTPRHCTISIFLLIPPRLFGTYVYSNYIYIRMYKDSQLS